MCKHTHTDSEANMCSDPTQKVRGSFLSFKLHSLVCFAAYSYLSAYVCPTAMSECVCTRWECAGTVLFRWHECLFWGIPVFGLYTSEVDTLISFFSETRHIFIKAEGVSEEKLTPNKLYHSPVPPVTEYVVTFFGKNESKRLQILQINRMWNRAKL